MGPSRPAFGSEARVPKRSALPCAFCYTSALTPHLKGTVVQGHRKESRLVSNVAQTDGCSSPEKCCYLSDLYYVSVYFEREREKKWKEQHYLTIDGIQKAK